MQVAQQLRSNCLRYGRLFHIHWNDNWKMFDYDLMVGMANLVETQELLFWLDKWGYDGWFDLDLFPYREAPEAAIEQSIKNIKFFYQMIDRVSRDEIRACFQISDAIRIAEILRKMLGNLD